MAKKLLTAVALGLSALPFHAAMAHGSAQARHGGGGKLTVLDGAEKSEAALLAVGNRLEAEGITPAPGAKVVAALVTAAAEAITVRFTVQ